MTEFIEKDPEKFLNIERIKSYAVGPPRVHGNGFIQIDLNIDARINVWGHPRIPRQIVASQIHNHRFSFRSVVLCGALVQQMWNQGLHGTLDMDAYQPQVREGEDTILILNGFVRMEMGMTSHLLEGDSYEMIRYAFHETFVNQPTITFMEKTAPGPEAATVLLPPGKKPDNDFNRHHVMPEADLWQIVSEVIDYHGPR